MSSQLSSCTNPTWLASMKHGSHIMLQRFVRSMVSTDPRPWVMVLVPWSCSFSSLCARMSRPGKTSSRCLKNAGSMDIRSSKCPWIGQSLTIRILPSRSMMLALISPTFSLRRISTGILPSRILLPDLGDALRAQRIGLARPAEWRLLFFLALQQRLVGPFRGERRIRVDRVQLVINKPRGIGCHRNHFLHVLDRLSQSGRS